MLKCFAQLQTRPCQFQQNCMDRSTPTYRHTHDESQQQRVRSRAICVRTGIDPLSIASYSRKVSRLRPFGHGVKMLSAIIAAYFDGGTYSSFVTSGCCREATPQKIKDARTHRERDVHVQQCYTCILEHPPVLPALKSVTVLNL